MKSEPINGHIIRRRRQLLGDQARMRTFARRTGLTGQSVRSIETTNRIPGETPLHQLTRIADVLGIPVADLLSRPHPPVPSHAQSPYEPGTADTLTKDVARLGRLLVRDQRLIRKVALATVFTWDRQRLKAAQDALTEQLRPAGITVHEVNGSIGLRPIDSQGDQDADEVLAYRVASSGMSLRQAELLSGILNGNLPTHQLTDDMLPLLGHLMNLGIVRHDMSAGAYSHRLTAASAYSFDVPDEA